MLKLVMGSDYINITENLPVTYSGEWFRLNLNRIIMSFYREPNKYDAIIKIKSDIEQNWNETLREVYVEVLTYLLENYYEISEVLNIANEKNLLDQNEWSSLLNIINRKDISSISEDKKYKYKEEFIDLLRSNNINKTELLNNQRFIENAIRYEKIFIIDITLEYLNDVSLDRKVSIYSEIMQYYSEYPTLLNPVYEEIVSLLIKQQAEFSKENIRDILTAWTYSSNDFNALLNTSLFSARNESGKIIIADVFKKYFKQIDSEVKINTHSVLKYVSYFYSYNKDLIFPFSEEEKNSILHELVSVCGFSVLLKYITPENISVFLEKDSQGLSTIEKALYTSAAKELAVGLSYIYNLPVCEKDRENIEILFKELNNNKIFKLQILPLLSQEFKPDDVMKQYETSYGYYNNIIQDLRKKREENPDKVTEEKIKEEETLINERNIYEADKSALFNMAHVLSMNLKSFKNNESFKSYISLYNKENGLKPVVDNEFEDYWLYTDADFKIFKDEVSAYSNEDDPAHKWVKKLDKTTGKRKIAKNKALMENIHTLREMFPNFNQFIDYIEDNLYLHAIGNNLLKINPSLLVSKPGIGKTFFLSKLAELAGTHGAMISMESITGGFILTGLDSRYSTGSPGLFFRNMLDSEYVNNLMILDEIDKCTTEKRHGGVEDVLLPLLEEHSAKSFRDEFLRLPIDMSHVNWIATANDVSRVSAPLMSRFKKFDIRSPNFNERKILAQSIYTTLLGKNSWGKGFHPVLNNEVLDSICQDQGSSRDLRKNIETAIARCARREGNGKREIIMKDVDTLNNQNINDWDKKTYE